MFNFYHHFSYSLTSLCLGAVAILSIIYIGLIAVVMSYAALTIEFSQSVRNDEAAIAILESRYLATVARIAGADYVTEGYAKPAAKVFVPAQSVTARR